MKKTMIFLAFIMAGLFVTNAHAQVSVGANFGMYKTAVENADPVYGFNIAGKYNFTDNLRAGINLGYYFKTTEILGTKITSYTMPVAAGVEYVFLSSDFSPFAGLDVGLYNYGARSKNSSSSKSYFGVAPIVGVEYKLADNLLLTGNFKYHLLLNEDVKNGLGFNIGAAFLF